MAHTEYAVVLRSLAYRLVTRRGDARLRAVESVHGGRAALRVAEWVLRRGEVRVGGGLGIGMRLSAAHLPIRHVQGHSLVRGSLEPSVQEALRRSVHPGAVVVDVGANLGFFSMLAGRLAGPEGSVWAIEPLPDTVEGLRANRDLNGAGNVTVLPLALAERCGRDRFLRIEEASWSHLADRGRHSGTLEEVEVDVFTFDALIEAGRIPPPDVVKVDVEGSELAVLRGMAQTLKRARPILIVELHATNDEVMDLLLSAGYCAHNLDGTVPVRDAGPIHLIATPCRTA